MNEKEVLTLAYLTGVDSGFLIGWGAHPLGSANVQFCQIFKKKLHEIEKNLVEGHDRGTLLDPPLLEFY